ncbi:MAG: MBL fold metallo-hydrolase [Candidatus Thermoplasmatota archaeon]|nr:MBL fold metallo-hydrolase [Candidatus Thermoplasmatota archaeon]
MYIRGTLGTMVHLSQLILGETGCVSYIVCCKKYKEAAVIDAFQGFENKVEEELERLGNPSIKYVMDTHTHADRRSSSSFFSEKHNTGGIVKSEKSKYKGKKIETRDGDVLEVGGAKIEVIFTPGHTYDHNCYLIDDHTLLVGDCLFIGDVGRIDLGGDLREKSDLLFDSLRRLEKMEHEIKVCPNHVGAAHAISSEDTFSTIGNELETNEALQIKDKDEFFTYMTEGWPPKPDDWKQIIEDNLNG